MRIEIWSDVVCPWCYLGKRRLERALGRLDWADEVTIRWRAFQLDPTATAEPRDLETAIDRKYGPGAFNSMSGRLTALGEVEGIDYRFDLALRVGTVDAHRLLAWAFAEAGGGAAQDALAERLFRAYFSEGANIADGATLAALAGEAGLDPAGAADTLAGDAYRDEVVADQEAAIDRNITGVPGFVVDDRLLIPGAQEADTLVTVLNRARERLGAGN